MNEKEQKLRDEIIRDAKQKAERRVARAKGDAEKLVAKSQKRHDRARQKRIDEVNHTADEKCRAITASIDHEKKRRWLLAREGELDVFFGASLKTIEAGEGIDQERSLRQLLEEALSSVGTGKLIVQARPLDAARLTPGLLSDVAKAALGADAADTTLSVTEVEGMGGGIILVSADGRRRFDNTYATRLVRMKRDLRAVICAGIDTADASVGAPEA